MKITVKDEPEQLVIALSGDDNTQDNVEEFKRIMEQARDRTSQTPVVLDITNLYYLGSEGVGIIAAAHKAFSERKFKLIVRNPTRQVSRVFMVTRLDSFLHIQREDGGPPK